MSRHPSTSRALVVLAAAVAAIAVAVAVGALSASATASAPRAVSTNPQCADPYSATPTPTNPLMVAGHTGSNPLTGASFFVNGPAHGAAAGAIAQLLGLATSGFPDSESYATFLSQTVDPKLGSVTSSIGDQIGELEKIASQMESQKVTIYSQGGGPGAIYSQTQKLFCHNFTADPGSIPVVLTYFLHPALGGCASPAQMSAYAPTFERRVNELISAIGNRPVVLLLEEDAFGSSSCMAKRGDLGDWEKLVKYEVDQAATLPHAVVYVEGGYSDSNSASYTARALNKVDIGKIRGFYTNDTHENWTSNEIKWGEQVSKMTHGANFVINTATNGQGPLKANNAVKNGNSVTCNPPGRGLGPQPTTNTGYAHVDAFLWTSVPGNSGGSCNGGTPSGTFWEAGAVALAAKANGKLGPGYPSKPY